MLIGDSKSLSVISFNTGQIDLTVSSLVSGLPFAIENPAAAVVGGGQSTSVTLGYMPTTASADSGTLTINSNDPDSPTTVLNLAGSGITEPPNLSGVCPVGNELIDPIPAGIAKGDLAVGFETVARRFC